MYRNMKLGDLGPLFLSTAKTTGVVFLVIATANIFNWLMAVENIPTKLALFFADNIGNKYLMIFVINALLLFLGTFMDATAAMVITVPILMKITAPFGIHPVMLGTIVVLNLMIGLLTPPVGLCLFIAGNISGISLERISRAVLPFLAVEIVVLLLVSYIEPIALFLPRFFGYI
ncbi:MAG: TRAP transporter large permease subunit [Desulfobacteraceae bacterium]|nr:MAG: TRAP transporter large permease subunit [Desulfobacteraceae bacterium]